MIDSRNAARMATKTPKIRPTATPRRSPWTSSQRTAGSRLTARNRATRTRSSSSRTDHTAAAAAIAASAPRARKNPQRNSAPGRARPATVSGSLGAGGNPTSRSRTSASADRSGSGPTRRLNGPAPSPAPTVWSAGYPPSGRPTAAGSGRRLPLAVVGGEDLLGRDLDAGLVEGDLEAGPELAGHLPLLQGAGLGHQADPDAVGAELLDPPDLRLLQDLGRPVLVDVQLVGDPLDGPGGVVQVGRVGDLDVDQRPGPALGAVADPADLPVGDVPQGAADVAQPGGAQPDPFHGAGGRAGVDHVPDPVLVLHEHEDAGDEVADQVLGAEPDGHPDDPGPGDQRAEVEADGAKGHQPGQGPDAEGGDALEQGPDRLGALDPAQAGDLPGAGQGPGGLEGGQAAVVGHVLDQPPDGPPDQPVGDPGGGQDGDGRGERHGVLEQTITFGGAGEQSFRSTVAKALRGLSTVQVEAGADEGGGQDEQDQQPDQHRDHDPAAGAGRVRVRGGGRRPG